jgi:tetratricopeptide (TPR) repeat protein
MTHSYTHIGFHLKKLRKEKRLTQSELAAGICSRSYISLLEKGLVTPSREILIQLAARLQVDRWEISGTGLPLLQYDLAALLDRLVHSIEQKNWGQAQAIMQRIEEKDAPPPENALYFWAKGVLDEENQAFAEAERWYRKSLELAKQEGWLEVQIRALDSLGALYGRNGNSGDPAGAAPLFHEALQLIQQGNVNGRVKISLLVNTGIMYLRLAEYVAAARYFSEAEQLNQAYRTDYKLDYIYNGLGIFFCATKQYDSAEHYMLEAIRIYEQKQNDPNVLIGAYTNLAIVYRLTDKDDLAVHYLQKANELARSIGFDYAIQNTYIELAKVLRKSGKLDEAADICRHVLQIGKDDTLAEARFVIAQILLDQGKETEALSLLEQSLEGFRKKSMNLFLPKTYQLLGQLYGKRGDYERSAQMYQQCCELTMSHWQNKTSVI